MYIFKITFDIEAMPWGQKINDDYSVIASDFCKAIKTIEDKEENSPFNLQQYVIEVTRKNFFGLIGE